MPAHVSLGGFLLIILALVGVALASSVLTLVYVRPLRRALGASVALIVSAVAYWRALAP